MVVSHVQICRNNIGIPELIYVHRWCSGMMVAGKRLVLNHSALEMSTSVNDMIDSNIPATSKEFCYITRSILRVHDGHIAVDGVRSGETGGVPRPFRLINIRPVSEGRENMIQFERMRADTYLQHSGEIRFKPYTYR